MQKIDGGLYLVLDPSKEKTMLLNQLSAALNGGVKVLQIWNNWRRGMLQDDKVLLINEIIKLAKHFSVPVLINEEWELLKHTELNGVHFDSVPTSLDQIKRDVGRDISIGITCGNNIELVKWADDHKVDYISFCSIYPSKSAGSCEIVSPDTIQKANELTNIPIFVSGGITPENLLQLEGLGVDGVAVISGILESKTPKKSSFAYIQSLNKI